MDARLNRFAIHVSNQPLATVASSIHIALQPQEIPITFQPQGHKENPGNRVGQAGRKIGVRTPCGRKRSIHRFNRQIKPQDMTPVNRLAGMRISVRPGGLGSPPTVWRIKLTTEYEQSSHRDP